MWESTDGAQAMAGKHSGLQALIRRVFTKAQWTHCLIHREALASKELSPELNSVLTDVITTVNYIKSRPLKSRILSSICEEMGSQHTALLWHSECRWLSRGKVLSRVFELKDEIGVFLTEEGHGFACKFHDEKFLHMLAYLSDISEAKWTEFTVARYQHRQNSFFHKKMKMWERRLAEACRNVDSFENLKAYLEKNELENTILPCMKAHISALQKHFGRYFPEDSAKYDWIQDPFQATAPADLSATEEEQCIDMASDSRKKLQFTSTSLAVFWIGVEKVYPLLGQRAMDILFVFCHILFM